MNCRMKQICVIYNEMFVEYEDSNHSMVCWKCDYSISCDAGPYTGIACLYFIRFLLLIKYLGYTGSYFLLPSLQNEKKYCR